MNTKFQNKLIGKLNETELKQNSENIKLIPKLKDDFVEIDEIPHGYLSPAFLPKKRLKDIYSEDEMRILYQSIYFHHNREKLDNHDEVKVIVKEDLSKYISDFTYD